MRLRTTIALVVVAAIAAVVVIINPFSSGEEEGSNSPWFYQVGMDDITEIAVNHQGQQVSFYKTDANTWAFTEPDGIPPNHERWGGMTLIFSGPGTNRDFSETVSIGAAEIENPAQYGLDTPPTIVDLGLTADRELQFRLGDRTTDGRHTYGQVVGFPQLFLIASSWGDVVSRLATEPPLPKWYVKRPIEEIIEINLFLEGNPEEEETEALRFTRNQDDNSWSVKHEPKDAEATPVDEGRFQAIVPLVHNAPDYISVELPLIDDLDYTPWGISEERSPAIEVRFASESQAGVRYIDGVLLLIGNESPDGTVYYAKNVDDTYQRQPLLTIKSELVEPLFALYENIPYAAAVTE
ncbi:MAG: DUF4340 domain-containing protein [Chloroflexi bacterium]|nr:DUF4340 domain-containing protein [Chloroflexota bacterium]